MNGPEIVMNPSSVNSTAGKIRSAPSTQNMYQSGCALLPTSPGHVRTQQGDVAPGHDHGRRRASSPPTHSSSVVDSANCAGHSGLPSTNRCPSMPRARELRVPLADHQQQVHARPHR